MPKKKCPKMEEQGCLFIVCPTLEMRLRASSNLKRVAMNANMEYSNFIKACKLESNLNLRTYLKCAKAFDKEVVLLHLPSGFVESITTVLYYRTKRSHGDCTQAIPNRHRSYTFSY